MFFFVNLYLQQVLGLGAFASGAALLPLTVTIMVGMVGVAPRLIERFGPKAMTVGGLAVLAAGLVWLSFIGPDGSFVAHVLPASLVTAAGMAMAFIPSPGLALSSAAPEECGLASGLVSTNCDVQVDLATGQVLVTTEQPLQTEQVRGAVEEAGYQIDTWPVRACAVVEDPA